MPPCAVGLVSSRPSKPQSRSSHSFFYISSLGEGQSSRQDKLNRLTLHPRVTPDAAVATEHCAFCDLFGDMCPALASQEK